MIPSEKNNEITRNNGVECRNRKEMLPTHVTVAWSEAGCWWRDEEELRERSGIQAVSAFGDGR